MKTSKRRVHIIRVLKVAVLTIAACLLLLLVCLAFLPSLVSSHSVQAKIQQSISSSMKRQVSWSNLVMTWKGGLTLSTLRLGDGPAPLLRADVDQIVIAPSFGHGADGHFGVDLAVRIRNVRAECAPGPQKPPLPKPTKDPLTLLAESIQRVQGFDFPLPVDLRVTIEVAPLQLAYRVPAPGKQLALRDFSFRFAMPSLAAKPVTAEIAGRVLVDRRDIGSISLNAKVTDLVTKARRIHLASALFAVDAAAPGTSLTFSGGLSHADGFAARWKLDLPGILTVAGPFIPPAVPKIDGNIELLLRAKSDANRDLHATLTLDAAGLAARGGSLKTKRVGPLDLKLQQRIVTDHERQRVEFPDGKVSIPVLFDAAWNASVLRPSVPEHTLDVAVGPLKLDLARALSLAGPFLPPDSPVRALAGHVSLHSLSLHLNGPKNKGDLALKGFSIKLPRVRMALKKGELAAEDIELILEKVECPLTATLPTGMTADLIWNVRKASISGAEPLSIQGARGKAGLSVTDLNLKSTSPRKVAASAILTQTFDLDRVSLGTRLRIDNVHEQLRFLARAAENGDIAANLPEFILTAASLQGTQSGKRYGPIPFSASLTASDLLLPVATGSKPTLHAATAKISASDFLQLAAEAALSGVSPQRAATSGSARIDLRRAMPFAAPFLPAGLKVDGVASAVWNLAAAVPDKALSADKHPLRSARAALKLFDTVDFGLKLDTISATVPLATGTITISGLHTRPDLRVVSTKKGESVRLEGGVLFSALSGLPGAAVKLPAQHGSFAFNGELTGWREFRLNEELRIDPLAFSNEAELNVSRIDALLEEKQPFSTATLLKRLDATLISNVEGVFSRDLKGFLPGVDLAGIISSGVRVDLSAGHELALRCSLKTKDFGVQLANGTTVEGMRSDILINRTYALAAIQGENWTPLSTALVRPVSVMGANPGAAEIVGRIHEDLRGDLNGARSFSIRRVTTMASGVPLVITSLEGDLLFTQEKAGLSFFQADLLGGTLLARGLFDLRPEVPSIVAATSFSNLDITQLLPKEARKGAVDQDAEITGEMSLSAPLTAEQRELLEQLRLALNIRRIGAHTIERALFSLDPYERNEQLVAQRKMLRLGGLKGLRATAVDGAVSMEGEARIKGVAVDLPKVDRLRISELPLRQELAKNRAGITALRGVLDLVRADTLVIGPKGELSLKRRTYAQ